MPVRFGTGAVFLAPVGGNTATNPTPFPCAVIKSAEVDFKRTNKTLFGQKQLPVAAAPGQMAVNGKITIGNFDPRLLNQIFFGQASAPGGIVIVQDEVLTIPASTPFTDTVANSADFSFDYGVKFADTSEQLIKLATGTPATGEYTVAAGEYTFAAADTGKKVKASYTYNSDDATMTTITLVNQQMGFGPVVRLGLGNSFQGSQFALELYQCIFGDFSMPTKQDDFWEMSMSFDAFCDSSETLGTISGSM